MSDLPDALVALVGVPRYHEQAVFPVDPFAIALGCSAVENANPLFWDPEVAGGLAGGPVAPPSMLSVWNRPLPWVPGRSDVPVPLRLHFEVKDLLGLPEALVSGNELVFHEPLRPGDVVSSFEVLRSVSGLRTTRLGTGRFWSIEVVVRNQRDELCGTDTYTAFGYRAPA